MFVFKVAVVGAGTIGGELAHAIASADIPVVLKDVDEQALAAGVARARALWQARADAGRLAPEEVDRRAALIAATTTYDGFGDVDLAIECVAERLELKEQVLAELDDATPGHAILASTTSTLSIDELAEATSRPDRVVGFHCFDPVSTKRLVEVVEGIETSPETVQATIAFAQAIRKTPIRCDDAPGFVVGRIRAAADEVADEPELAELRALVEACHVLEDGVAAAREIDVAMAGAEMAPPPLAWADRVGLDVALERLARAHAEHGEAFAPPPVLRRLVAQGRTGAASGQGFFPAARPDAGWDEGPVKLETRGPVAIAWLDRPPANSLGPETVAALRRAWDHVDGSAELRALVVASASSTLFCAGADIKAFTTMDAAACRAFVDEMHELLRAFERSSTVTIAAVNALAYGGGCELAMACDVRLAASSATFGQPEVELGIVPGFGGTQRLPRLVGEAKALEMNLAGTPLSAEEAYEFGLVNRIVPDHELFDVALLWARKLAGQAPLAVERIKRVSAAADLDAGLAAEREAFAAVFASEDAREGLAAFLGKRPPRFRGR